MVSTLAHPRILERAATTLRSRLVAQQQCGCVALENAIERAQELKRTTGLASCDVLIAGYEQVLAEVKAISPTAPPSAESVNLLIARINLFGKFFVFLTQLAVVTGSLGTRAHIGGEPAAAEVAPATAPLPPALAVGTGTSRTKPS